MTPQQQAQQWLDHNCLILDTETTGLDDYDEIVEIAIIDCVGNILLNTLVKPSRPIPRQATAIHGITNEMVKDAPRWPEVYSKVIDLVANQTVITYNASYDSRLILQTNNIYEIGIEYCSRQPKYECAMLAYAEFYGQSDSRHSGYKWQKLTAAAEQQGITIEGTAHRALSDCLTTFGVIKTMAAGSRHHASVQSGASGAQKAADILTRLFCADPDAITALVDHRVECSEEFATKTAATVGVDDSAYVVGMIGIINALIAPEVIAAIYDGGALTGFTVFNDTPKGEDL